MGSKGAGARSGIRSDSAETQGALSLELRARQKKDTAGPLPKSGPFFLVVVGGAFQEGSALARTRRGAQLAQRFRFDLPDTLASNGKRLADFLERVFAAIVETEAHFDDFFFARRQGL